MLFEFRLYTLMFFAGGIAGVVLACIFINRYPAKGAWPLALFALACAEWSLASGLEAAAVRIPDKILLSQIEYLGVCASGVLWLIFALDYTGSQWWKNAAHIIWVSIVPVSILISVFTNNLHHLYWSDVQIVQSALGPISVYLRGPWYWVNLIYNYAIYAVGVLILLRYAMRNPLLYRRQIAGIVIGTLTPFAANIVYMLKIFPVPSLDLTPFMFIIGGLIYSFSIFRLRFMEVVPIARSRLIENMQEGILVFDAWGTIKDMNPAAETIIGKKRAESLGHNAIKMWPRLKKSLLTMDSRNALEIHLGDGVRERTVEVDSISIYTPKNSYMGQMLVLRDVTDRRRIEQRLRESEARYVTLVEQSNEGVIIIKNGICVFINRRVSLASGYTPDEICGQSLVAIVAEEDRTAVNECYSRWLAGFPMKNVCELSIMYKNGEKRIVEISVGDILYEGERAQLLSLRDITERKNTRQELELLYRQELELKQSLQAEIDKRTRYTQSLVHELKSPLAEMSESIQELEVRLVNEIYLALARNIRRSIVNLEQRIDELIELARGEVGLLKIIPVELDITTVLREIVAELTPVAAKKGLMFTVNIPDLPHIMGDRSRIRQIMTNLISNSIKFTNRGTIDVKAEVTENNRLLVQVSDTGRGMDREELDNIFNPYRRSKHDTVGLGIGLALSKIFVELHQGSIQAESSQGEGSTFSFTLPIQSRLNIN